MTADRTRRVLIAGCGDLGLALATALAPATVHGLRRQVDALPAEVLPIAADLLTGAGFDALPAGIDTLVYMPTAGQRAESAYRAIYIEALPRLLAALPQPAANLRLVWVSSTAVYGQNRGERVDEQSAPAPAPWNGALLLEAERSAQALVADTRILRCAGLYGPGRLWMLRRVRAGAAIAAGTHWTNRIHLADAGQLLARLVEAPQAPSVTIAVDDAPTPESEVLDWLADRLDLPHLPRQGDSDQVSGKRLCNDLARSLGWRPLYADYRSGYAQVLGAE